MRRAVAACAVFLVAVAGVAVAAAARRHVRPGVQMVSTSVAGSSVRFALRVSFAAPTGVRGPSPCSDRVTARARGRRWSARLGRAPAGSAATVHGRLPATLGGRRITFRVDFPGNRAVAPFTVRRRLLLRTAPTLRPIPTPPPPLP